MYYPKIRVMGTELQRIATYLPEQILISRNFHGD